MKRVLTGLLMFSQAAVEATTIDRTNYRQHLCDDGLFKATTPGPIDPAHPNPNYPSAVESGARSLIAANYQNYCGFRSQYEIAIEEASHFRRGTGQLHPCGSVQKDMVTSEACIETSGITYAQVCETLKQEKATYKNAWNYVIPTLESCNNARRRR